MSELRSRRGFSHSPAEFERLYRECYNEVYSHILFRMLDEEAARDVTSDAFLRAARFFETFDPSRAKFATWVKVIARNCMIDYYRKQKTQVPIDDVPEGAFASEEDHAEQTVNTDLARQLLLELSESDRELIRLKFFEDLPNKEIAERLGMNASTVATRVQRALATMRSVGEKALQAGN